jgi:hypothetical protein
MTPFMRAALHWVLLATRNRQILTGKSETSAGRAAADPGLAR